MIIVQEALIFGFTQSFVIGPLTLLALREGLNPKQGIWYEIQVVAAGTMVDLMYLILSLNGIAHFINDIKIQAIMWTGAALLLVFMGVNSLNLHKKKSVHHNIHRHHVQRHLHIAQSSFSKGFFIGLMNPMSLVFWVMVAGSMYTQYTNVVSPNIFALNIVSGGIVGTLIIVMLTYMFRKFFQKRTLARMVTMGSILLIGYGIWFTFKAILEWQTVMAVTFV